MKTLKFLPLMLLFLAASCSTVRVTTDYDTNADFSKYKAFAFYKKGIDKVDFSNKDQEELFWEDFVTHIWDRLKTNDL